MTDEAERLVGSLLDRCVFPPPGSSVCCAVSGGPDSLALLVLACRAGCRVTAAHVDHRLRPSGAAEAALVAAAAARFGASFVSFAVDVAPGPNLEARARAARRAVLPADVLTGHTVDDRAETMLLNLLRGSGSAGLSAMGPSPRRPIIALRRSETRALCAAVGLEPFEDPTNTDPRFRRNRVRHELLPLLDDIAERDVAMLLVRLGDHLASVQDLVLSLAGTVDPRDASALTAAPAPVAAAAVQAWLREGSGPERHPPDAATVARVLEVARGERRATQVGGGRRIRRAKGRLYLERDENRSIGTESDPVTGLP